ncbi:MAG: type II toxin-antitoxin system PemK/MazF family toxin [bacterium]|nr:type II toxin-antitoxin system PemK/MazF family toxin [bacterium]
MARGLERGEIRLYRFAAPDKQRPVLVLTRHTALPYLSKVTVAPITSSVRGVPSEVVLDEGDGMKQTCAINLFSLSTVAAEKLGRRVARLGGDRMREVCTALRFALGCEDA